MVLKRDVTGHALLLGFRTIRFAMVLKSAQPHRGCVVLLVPFLTFVLMLLTRRAIGGSPKTVEVENDMRLTSGQSAEMREASACAVDRTDDA